ncbi:GntR family transcriptional regulator [Planctomicrobium sp. SH664]|uniref:GntR family transcriptional regulator n=1 Tax=Planctomicrobium sp. SH664 TaxID=3448125 RepID=UPI003F5BC2C9
MDQLKSTDRKPTVRRQQEVSTQPKYERLRDLVAAQIRSGELQAGELLPSELQFAGTLQMARSTVRQALSSLERDGLVRRVHGKGTYVHEQARQRLKVGQDLLALIVPETDSGFYPALQKSFENAAADVHNQVVVCNSGNEIDRQGNCILQLIDLQVAGVAIVPTTRPQTPAFQIRQLQQHGIPVVCCSRKVEGVQAPLLAIPFDVVGRTAGRAIGSRGHRRVALVTGDLTESVTLMEQAFRQALGDQVDLQVCYGAVASTVVSRHEQELEQMLDRLFALPAPPTAIFCTFDSYAEMLYVLLGRRGIRIPEDVSLVGFGGARRIGAIQSRLVSVTLDEELLGREAIDLLNRMRSGELPIDLAVTRDLPIGLSEGTSLKTSGITGRPCS